MEIDEEFVAGYRDGRDPSCLPPGPNRSQAYRHSFRVGRAELEDRPIPAAVSRRRVDAILEEDGAQQW